MNIVVVTYVQAVAAVKPGSRGMLADMVVTYVRLFLENRISVTATTNKNTLKPATTTTKNKQKSESPKRGYLNVPGYHLRGSTHVLN